LTGLRPPVREAILTAALDVFSHNPGATLDDVVARSGVARATLFRQFRTRDDLIREVAVRSIGRLGDAVRGLRPGATADRLRSLVDVLVASGDDLHFLLHHPAMESDPLVIAASASVDAEIAPILLAAQAEGYVRDDLPPGWLWKAMEAVIYASWQAVQAGTLARADAPRLVWETLLRGVGGRAVAAAPG
jgi:AcrR family transcriptional regulator